MDIDLQACIDGDPQAWSAFVERTMPVIAAAVRRVIRPGPAGSRELAEDAIQEVFVRLIARDYRLLRMYDEERAKLTTWLTVVARSTAIDMLRRRRLETVSLDAEPPGAALAASHVDPPNDASAKGAELPLHLLTDRQRLVLTLLFDDGLPVSKAAIVLGVDDQTVRSTKHKAIARLRAHFESESHAAAEGEKESDSPGRSPAPDA